MKNASLVLMALILLLAIPLPSPLHAAEAEPASEDARVQLHLRLKEDQALLEKLEAQLESRETESARLAAEIDTQAARVKRLKEEIGRRAEGGQPTSEQEKKLTEAEARYKRLRLTAETGLQEIASLKERIASLRKQIAAAEAILAPVDETKEGEKTTPPPAESPAPTAPATLPELALAPSPEVAATPPTAGEATTSLRPEQIEAAKMAERRAREALKAEQDVVNYVERLTALKTQIQVTEDQIDSQKKTLRELSSLAAELENRMATEGRTEALQQELLGTRKTIAEVEKKRAASEKILADLREQERALEAEEAQFVAAAETRRKEAEKARRESQWLQSPLHPRNVAAWLEQRGPRLLIAILAIIVLLFLSRLLVSTLVRISTRRLRGGSIGRVKRIETLGAGYDAVARFVILTGGIFLLMEEAGIDLTALLGGAAIVGVAVAFGAQNLIRDYFNGFMILLEDQYELGDLVTIGDLTGTVERVNMRTTVLRDLEGRVHFIPNSTVNGVTNRTYQWANALFDIPLPLDVSVDPVLDLLMEEAEALRRDPEWTSSILAEPTMLGVDRLGPAAIHIKFLLRTRADAKFQVRREMLRRIKNRFDREGIAIPDQRCVVQA